jgi:hypothetical protein
MSTLKRFPCGHHRLATAFLLAFAAGSVITANQTHAQTGGQQPTAIGVAAPASALLGQDVALQAKLVAAGGAPVAGVVVTFAMPATFLNGSGDMVVAEAKTDKQGIASAQFQARRSGAITITAMFSGDDTYAPAKSSTQTTVTGSQQLYQEHAGVSIPGLNEAPGQAGSSGALPHWALSGWPIGAVLVVVYSLYGAAVFFMSKIATPGAGPSSGEPTIPGEAMR